MPDLRFPSDEQELMDTSSYPPETVSETLGFLKMTNRFFGGTNVILSFLGQWLPRQGLSSAFRILDVGTGAADIPIAITRWATRKGFEVQITALEKDSGIAEYARRQTAKISNIHIMTDDLLALSKSGQTFDYVVASLFLHHVSVDQRASTIRILDQLSVRGLIISDLQRTRAAHWAVSVLSYVAGNAVVRHDGPASVRRGFLPSELEDLALQTNLSYLKTRCHPWFRLSLAGLKESL